MSDDAGVRALSAAEFEVLHLGYDDYKGNAEVALAAYRAALEACPLCRGKIGSTPTVGRWECTACGAMLLRGRL